MSSQPSGSLTGKRLSTYKLDRLIGSGGMAEVYLARESSGKQVAVKVLSPLLAHDPDGVARFRREAEAAQRLEHPHVVKVLDMGEHRGTYFIVMEKLRGQSFRRMLRKGDEPRKVMAALAQVAKALAYAHDHGIIHRDIKPENVLLGRRGEAKVADFGLARVVDASSFTTDGALIGTAKYMSPEQAQGKRANAASDVYSLGVMLYEALSGELPFESESPHGFLFQHAVKTPTKPRTRPGFPARLSKLCLRCLDKDPERRPSMHEVAEELDRAALVRPVGWRMVRWLFVLLLVGSALAVLAYPHLLDPLTEGWRGAPWVRDVQEAAGRARSYLLSKALP